MAMVINVTISITSGCRSTTVSVLSYTERIQSNTLSLAR